MDRRAFIATIGAAIAAPAQPSPVETSGYAREFCARGATYKGVLTVAEVRQREEMSVEFWRAANPNLNVSST